MAKAAESAASDDATTPRNAGEIDTTPLADAPAAVGAAVPVPITICVGDVPSKEKNNDLSEIA